MKNVVMMLSAAVLGGLLAGAMMPGSRVEAFQSIPGLPGDRPVRMATGGATANQQDLCWLVTKVRMAGGQERTMLLMYKAERNGDHFNLKDCRWIDPDFRYGELKKREHLQAGVGVEQIYGALGPEDQRELRPPEKKPEEEKDGKPGK